MKNKFQTPEEHRAARASRKADYHLYRRIAKVLATSISPPTSVQDHAPVHITDDGAFVEAQIWISEKLLAEAKAGSKSDEHVGDVPNGGADPIRKGDDQFRKVLKTRLEKDNDDLA